MGNFMPFIAFFIIFGFLLWIIIKAVQQQKHKNMYTKGLIPPLWADEETTLLFQRFNAAWSTTIEETTNERIRANRPELTNVELRERWHELKKFLFLAGISKKLPMFSEEVDEIWHFFLEEKALYQKFCADFIGEMIEHHPHDTPQYMPKERAWFDILYLSFFTVSSHSSLWGAFLKEDAEHQIWIGKILDHPDEIIHLFGKPTATAESIYTLKNFLQFARKQLTADTPEYAYERIQQTDGYWYGAALFSLYFYDSTEDFFHHKKDIYTRDSAGGSVYIDSSEREKEWDDLKEDVNHYEDGTSDTSSSGGFFGNDSHDSGSDSGSSCSSCSSCSS